MENTTEKETHSSHNSSKVIGALLVGSVLGAGLGLLFAPETGDGTRKKVWEELQDALGTIKSKVGEHHCEGCNCKKEEEASKKA